MLRGKVMSACRPVWGEVEGAAGGAGRQEGSAPGGESRPGVCKKKKRHLQEVEEDLCWGA